MDSNRAELGDELLGAYADGELDDVTRSRVTRALANDPEAQRRLTAIRDITALVRAASNARDHGPTAATPATTAAAAPAEQRPAAPMYRSVRPRPAWADWRLAASFLVGALLVGLGTQLVGGRAADTADWQRSALAFHNTYLRARANEKSDLLIDFGATQDDDLAGNVTSLIDYTPTIPDLSAHRYAPTGMRLLSLPKGATMFVVYEGPGLSPVGFSMTPSDPSTPSTPGSHTLGDVRLVSWSDGGFEYGLSSDVPGDTLSSLAETAQRSIGGQPGQPTL